MISTLFRINDEVVFYSPTIAARKALLWNRILTEQVLCFDCDGARIHPPLASIMFTEVCDRFIGTSTADKIHANILLFPVILSLFRADYISLPVEEGMAIMNDMGKVFSMLAAGMYGSAVELMSSMPTPSWTTQAKWTKYITMISSADAIK